MTLVLRQISAVRYIKPNSFLVPKNIKVGHCAGLITKSERGPDYEKPHPFDYKETQYNFLIACIDRCEWRFDENTKLIAVEGPDSSGKDKIAKAIANEFDMKYFPHANLEYTYIQGGTDIRSINDQLPLITRSFEPLEFAKNPKDERSCLFQMNMFRSKLKQYIDALVHLLSTGDGVVLNRTLYSNFVFNDTYAKFGFINKSMIYYHNKVWNALRRDLLRPHVIVYLDTPVEKVRENLKKEHHQAPQIYNSPLYQPDVLQHMENLYKRNYLKNMSKYCKILLYDCSSEMVDPEVVCEDLETLNLEYNETDEFMFEDWWTHDEWQWIQKRLRFTRDRHEYEMWGHIIPPLEVPELWIEPDDSDEWETKTRALPGNYWAPGYNADVGDFVTFKSG